VGVTINPRKLSIPFRHRNYSLADDGFRVVQEAKTQTKVSQLL